MQTATRSIWMEELSKARTWHEAENIVELAIGSNNRIELIAFLQALYEEFIGPDTAGGGESGTHDRIKRLFGVILPTDAELLSLGLNPTDFRSIINHD